MDYPLDKQKNILGLFFTFIVLIATLTFGTVLNKFNLEKTSVFWIGRWSIWFCLLLIFLFVNQIENQKILLWTEQRLTFLDYFISFLKINGSILLGVFIVGLIFKLAGIKQTQGAKIIEIVTVLKTNFPLLIFTCITAAVTEEIIFRGYLIPRLQIIFKNKYISITISSLLFGLMHFGYGTIFQIIGPAIIGLVFALHYQKYRNLKILIFCHFFWDFMSLMAQTHLKL